MAVLSGKISSRLGGSFSRCDPRSLVDSGLACDCKGLFKSTATSLVGASLVCDTSDGTGRSGANARHTTSLFLVTGDLFISASSPTTRQYKILDLAWNLIGTGFLLEIHDGSVCTGGIDLPRMGQKTSRADCKKLCRNIFLWRTVFDAGCNLEYSK